MHTLRFPCLAVAVLALGALTPSTTAQADAPLPTPQFPDENPLLPDQDILGKFLFWEEQISRDNTMSCGTCHIHEAGGTDPRVAINPGPDGEFGTDDDILGSAGVVRHDLNNELIHEGSFFPNVQVTGRQAPSTINSALNFSQFWDGRAEEVYVDPMSGLQEIAYGGSLESQAAGPPTSDVEMGPVAQTWENIVAKLATVRPLALATDLPADMQDFLDTYGNYPNMFEAVYGSPVIDSKGVVFAIANYERTLISNETVLDDFLGGKISQFPPQYQPGFDLFQGNANCATCHTMPLTHDSDFHNIGVRPDSEDFGREDFTGDIADRGKFKTPHIRNLRLSSPYFHAGTKDTITELVEFYNNGGDFPGPNLDVSLLPLNLTQQEKDDLILFLDEATLDQRVVDNAFPFTRPTLRSELPPLNTEYGVESADGDGGFATMIAHQPANRGHSNFIIGVDTDTPNAGTLLMWAFAPDAAGTPYPDPRFPVPINIDLSSLFLSVSLVTDANGVASYNLPIPKSTALQGFKIYAQWVTEDVDALSTGGLYGTKGVEIEIL